MLINCNALKILCKRHVTLCCRYKIWALSALVDINVTMQRVAVSGTLAKYVSKQVWLQDQICLKGRGSLIIDA